jgi:tRNA modification GTPase
LGEARPDALVQALAAVARGRLAMGQGEGAVLTRARHRAAVFKARASLARAWESAQRGLGHELVALDLREALDALGEVLGKTRADDILARIFAEFCVGK